MCKDLGLKENSEKQKVFRFWYSLSDEERNFIRIHMPKEIVQARM